MNQLFLGVNIDHVATLRQARGTLYPCPIQMALNAELAGADGITLHLREDRRHIQDNDVFVLRHLLKTRMNFEMAVTEEMIDIAKQVKPQHCCLVPEKREELTTEGGLDVVTHFDKVAHAVQQLSQLGSEVSLFIDADKAQIEAAKATGASTIEIHTGQYAELAGEGQQACLEEITAAAWFAHEQGLIVNAGHGLNEHNVTPIASIPVMHELNIGHALIAKALAVGLDKAIKEMKTLMYQARRTS